MSAITTLEATVFDVQEQFEAVCVDRSINFRREAEFAIQVLCNSDYALKIANSNPQSVRNAVTNIAAIGLSLNPAKKQAYLVPRDGKICLDISYMGLIEIAVASGSILWARAKLVREGDVYEPHGFDKPPTHTYNAFSAERKTAPIVGAYVVAKTRDGDYLTGEMQIDEIYDIRNRSAAWKAFVKDGKKCPWVTDEGEMIKKTVLKREYKTWPRTDRLDAAVHYLNTDGDEGLAEDDAGDPVVKVDHKKIVGQVAESHSLQDLEALWKNAAEQCRKAKDRVAYDQIKTAVMKRLDELKKAAVEEPQ